MLVLTRGTEEAIVLGNDIVVQVLSVRGKHVRLGIDAPTEVIVLRSELLEYDRPNGCDESNQQASPRSSHSEG